MQRYVSQSHKFKINGLYEFPLNLASPEKDFWQHIVEIFGHRDMSAINTMDLVSHEKKMFGKKVNLTARLD